MENINCPLFGADIFAPKPKKEKKLKKRKEVEKKYIYLPMKQEKIRVPLGKLEPIEGEEWAVIPQAPDFIISTHGRIFNMRTMRSLTPYRQNDRRYLYARVNDVEGRRLMLSIHKLTYQLFGASYLIYQDDGQVVDVNIGYSAPHISDEAPY